MNSRLNLIRDNPSINRKRKFEGENTETPTKRPFLLTTPPAPSYHPYRSENPDGHLWSRRTKDVEETVRCSANTRLKRIRRSIEESKQTTKVAKDPPLTTHNKLQSPSTSTRTASSSGSSYQRKSPIITARPSSLQERLNKARNSDGFHSRNDQPQKSVITDDAWFKELDRRSKYNDDQISSTIIARTLNFSVPPPTIISNPWNRNKSFEQASPKSNYSHQRSPAFKHYDRSPVCTNLPTNNVVADNSMPRASTASNPTHRDDQSSDEAMDWDNIPENEIISNLQELRKNTKITTAEPQTPFQETIAREATEIQHNKVLLKTVYIVVDTNIFLSQLETVKKAMKLKLNGTGIGVCRPIVFIPWMVIQELDYIKDGRHNIKLKHKAQLAIHFINECFRNKTNLKGQSVRDAAQQDFASANFDDGILHCCLQIRDRRNRAILLSNDVNLRNKLLNEDFEAYGHDKIFKKLDPYHLSIPKPTTTEKNVEQSVPITDMMTRLRHLCTLIIMKALKDSYGDLWNKLGAISKALPWSLEYCLELFKKFWIPVFQMHMRKHGIKHIDEFSKFLKSCHGVVTDGEKLLHFSLTLCIHLKSGYPAHNAAVTECINSMEKLYDDCNRFQMSNPK